MFAHIFQRNFVVTVCCIYVLGQVGITLRIVSMQVPLDPQIKAVSALLGTEWISLEDIQTKMSSLKRSQRLSVAHPDAVSVKVTDEAAAWPTDTAVESPGCCCCCCWCCCRQSSKKKVSSKNGKPVTHDDTAAADPLNVNEINKSSNQPATSEYKALVVTYQPGHRTKSASIECIAMGDATNGQFGDSMSSLRRAADRVHSRCTAIYSDIYELGSEPRIAVDRYFEQDRGILVLNTESLGAGSGVTILCICTLGEHVQRLKDDVQSGKLKSDLERVVSNASKTLVRIDVRVDESDLALAESELNK